jgi:type IV fimbrial biogenesis protein FimT
MPATDPDQHGTPQRHRPREKLLALAAWRHGVSLIELMMALAVASILFSSAMPDMRQTIEAIQLRSSAADLLAAIHETRAEAMSRGQIVTLLANNGDWNQGWSIIVDSNANRVLDPGERLLKWHRSVPKAVEVRSGFTDPTAPFYIAYNSAGRSCRPAHPKAANFGTISLIAGEQQRNIKINMLGRVRLCDPARESPCTGVD